MDGDTQKDLVLTEARAMVIREYLVENFGFDDSQLKTLGMGKQAGANAGSGLGLDPDSYLSARNGDTGGEAGPGGRRSGKRSRSASPVTAPAAQKP
jgi:hypothetical protein